MGRFIPSPGEGVTRSLSQPGLAGKFLDFLGFTETAASSAKGTAVDGGVRLAYPNQWLSTFAQSQMI
jgi:hypothetical protein